MLPLTITAAAIVIAVVIVALVNFRFLMYPLIPSLNPVAHANQLQVKGNTLFISDLHLQSNRPFNHAKDLRNFIVTNNVSNLVIDGDFFDSPRDAQQILGASRSESSALKVLGLEGLAVNMFWVIGSPPHDPVDLANNEMASGSLRVLGKCAFIDCGRLEVMAYHGHDISHKGTFSHAWDRFVSRLSLERLWKRLAKIDRAVWVIFGHTHVEGVDTRSRVANCGGWLTNPLVRPSRTGILISEQEDTPKLVRIA
jgi:predicted phosphodiesterase